MTYCLSVEATKTNNLKRQNIHNMWEKIYVFYSTMASMESVVPDLGGIPPQVKILLHQRRNFHILVSFAGDNKKVKSFKYLIFEKRSSSSWAED